MRRYLGMSLVAVFLTGGGILQAASIIDGSFESPLVPAGGGTSPDISYALKMSDFQPQSRLTKAVTPNLEEISRKSASLRSDFETFSAGVCW